VFSCLEEQVQLGCFRQYHNSHEGSVLAPQQGECQNAKDLSSDTHNSSRFDILSSALVFENGSSINEHGNQSQPYIPSTGHEFRSRSARHEPWIHPNLLLLYFKVIRPSYLPSAPRPPQSSRRDGCGVPHTVRGFSPFLITLITILSF
jgi:hypothetical protein